MCKTGHRLDDHDVLRIVGAEQTFVENRTQAISKVQLGTMGRNSITIPTLAGRLLDEMQFLDVAGDGCLGTLDTARQKTLQQLLLRFDILFRNDLQKMVLTIVFHTQFPPVPNFLSRISQKLFLERRTSFVVCLDLLTRTLSPFFRENALPPSTDKYTNFRLASAASTVIT